MNKDPTERNVQVFDENEILGTWEGHIDGFVYDDGEVWADIDSLTAWRANHRVYYNCRGCGILSRDAICPNCRHTDQVYGTLTAP